MKNTIAQGRFTGKIYPDRSFTLGYTYQKEVRAEDGRYERELRQQEPSNELDVVDWLIGSATIEGKFESMSEGPLLVKGPKSSQEIRGAYGKHGITGLGKRVCRNTPILLQRKYGRKCLGFGTTTLPRVSFETAKAILRGWADIVRRFFQKLKRICEAAGGEFIYVACTEIQEKRFGDTGIAAPHLHFVYVAKRHISRGYYFSTKQAYTAWNDSVNEVLQASGHPAIMGVNGHIGSAKLEPIKKSAAAYLGKYLSKGIKVVKQMQEKGYSDFPKQWWSASKIAKTMFKDSIIPSDGAFGAALFYQLEHFLDEGQVIWARFVDCLIGDEYPTIGLVGVFSVEAYRLLST